MTAVIISHGSMKDFDYYKRIIEGCRPVICADGGVYYAKEIGITPDVIVGDFDSVDRETLASFTGARVIRFPVRKDKTDTELAVDYAIEHGEKDIMLLGSSGSRLDHTFANIALLKTMLDRGVSGQIIDEHNRLFMITDYARLEGKGLQVSLIPFGGKVTGITLRGFAYPLENETLDLGSTRGISNVLEQDFGEIYITSGILLVVLAKD
jgi:thiamine pyrophosphokinase